MRSPVLAGRGAELGTVARLASPTRSGGGVLAVCGEAGIGKTALVKAAIADERLVIGRTNIPPAASLGVVIELAWGLVSRGADVTSPYLGPYAPALTALLPELVSGQSGTTEVPHPLVLAEALLRLWATLAVPERPVLLAEDLHWADGQTWEVLRSLAERAPRAGACLVLTTRPEGTPWKIVCRLAETRSVELVELVPLGAPALAEMVSACLEVDVGELPEGLIGRLAVTGGRPLLIEEVLSDLLASGALERSPTGWHFSAVGEVSIPATVELTTAARLDGLLPADRQLMEMAAVCGRHLDSGLLAEAAGVEAAQLAATIRRCVAVGLLELERPSGVPTFRHDLLRGAVVGQLVDVQRRGHARRLLWALGRSGEASDLSWADRLSDEQLALGARLADDSGEVSLGGQLHLHAARRLLGRGLPSAAVAAADAAVESLTAAGRPFGADRTDALECLVEALALAGDVERSLQVATRLEVVGSLAARPRVGESLVRALALQRGWEQAADELSRWRSSDEAPGTTAVAAMVALELGDFERAELEARRVLATDGYGAPACEAMEVLGRLARRFDLDSALRWFEGAQAVAEQSGLALWRARAMHEAATIAQLRSLDVGPLEEARVAAVAAGAPGLVTAVDFHLASVHGVRFESEPALVAARRLLGDARGLGARKQEAWAWILVAQAHAVAGHAAQAESAGNEALQRVQGDAEVDGLVAGLCRALPALLGEDIAGATKQIGAGVESLRRLPSPTPLPPWYLWPVLATVLDIEGDGGRRARAELEHSDLRVVAGPDGLWHLGNAIAAGRAGDRAAADEEAASAESCFRRMPGFAGWQHLGLRWAAADAIEAGWGEPARWMPAAEEWMAERGFTAVAAACRGLARRAGAPQRRRRGSGEVPAHLVRLGVTAREVDVLRLLADGLTNAEIAERLYLSPRTVKGYVEQLLAKTASANRTQLARQLVG